MAYDKIIPIRARLNDCLRYVQNGEKTALSHALDYIADAEKSAIDGEVILQSALNCTLEASFLDMQRTKLRFGKQGGVVGYPDAFFSFAAAMSRGSFSGLERLMEISSSPYFVSETQCSSFAMRSRRM